MKNYCQEPSYTWEDVLYLLEVHNGDHDGWDHLHSSGFCLRFPKMYNTWHLSEKWLSRTSLYLQDILDLPEVPEVPDGDPDVWGHIHSTGFCLRFPKIYKTSGVK